MTAGWGEGRAQGGETSSVRLREQEQEKQEHNREHTDFYIPSRCRHRSNHIDTRSRILSTCIAVNRAVPSPSPTIDMSGAKKLLPLLDRVLVERARAGAQKSAGGILLPESASKVRHVTRAAGGFRAFLLEFERLSPVVPSVVPSANEFGRSQPVTVDDTAGHGRSRPVTSDDTAGHGRRHGSGIPATLRTRLSPHRRLLPRHRRSTRDRSLPWVPDGGL
jgi:hypothetical protein